MSTECVLADASIFPALRRNLLSIIQTPATAPVVSRIITMKSAARIRAILADAELKGATLHTALQNTNNTSALFPTGTAVIPATLVEGILPTMDLYGQEYFGPLLSIISVDSVEKVVSIVNECQYGLSAAIHTKNHYEALFFAKRLKVGAVHVNGATVHDESTLPHGGHGDSGWGRFGAGWGLSEFVHTKTVVFNK